MGGESIECLSNEIGGDFVSEIQQIELKGWTKKDIRGLSQEVELENIYRWVVDSFWSDHHKRVVM